MQTKTIIRCAALLVCLAAIHHRAAAQFFGVRVNALAALTGTVAVGAEAALTDNWTVETSAYWNPHGAPHDAGRGRTARRPTLVLRRFRRALSGAARLLGRLPHRQPSPHLRRAGLRYRHKLRLCVDPLEALEPRRGGRCGTLSHARHAPRSGHERLGRPLYPPRAALDARTVETGSLLQLPVLICYSVTFYP